MSRRQAVYSIKIESYFSSAHSLRGYKGKCEDLHGHNWKVEVTLESAKLDKIGLLLDFHELKNKLNAILEKLDHKYLNNLAYFKKVNPTSENIAKFIYVSLKSKVKFLKSVTVWESHNSSASYYEQ
jgi:6-pyruvoyltetrahydropterin/6-carboxytetrahydropterin synthase